MPSSEFIITRLPNLRQGHFSQRWKENEKGPCRRERDFPQGPLPLHLQECFAYLGGKPGDMPASEKVASEILSLPIYPESTDDQRREVVSAIAEFMKG